MRGVSHSPLVAYHLPNPSQPPPRFGHRLVLVEDWPSPKTGRAQKLAASKKWQRSNAIARVLVPRHPWGWVRACVC